MKKNQKKSKKEIRKKIQEFPRPKIDFSPKVPPVKSFDDKTKINIRYCILSPFVYAHIYWNPEEYDLIYEIEEPVLDKKEKDQKEKDKGEKTRAEKTEEKSSEMEYASEAEEESEEKEKSKIFAQREQFKAELHAVSEEDPRASETDEQDDN